MHMKRLILLNALLAISFQTGHAQEYKVYSPGNDSCGLFTQTVNAADSGRKTSYLTWIDNTLSQANTAAAKNPKSGKADPAAALESIKKYCTAQPDSSIAQATRAYLEAANVDIRNSNLDNGDFYGNE
jgi:hypothetical protein